MHVSDLFSNKDSPQFATTWATKVGSQSKFTKINGWTPIRLSGRIRFNNTKKPSNTKTNDNEKKVVNNNNNVNFVPGDPKNKKFSRKSLFPGCTHQFQEYCQYTSLHGFRYVTEEKRSLSERIFWICWCIFGITSAGYMMSKIWQRWQTNPVLTSIATTNLPVSAINFPAVTICTVNKAVSEKLIIQGCRLGLNFTEMRQIISTLVDPESKNNDDEDEEKGKHRIKPNDALQLLRLVAPKCSDFILRCELNGRTTQCKELFKLVLTDTGYCCTFNAMDAKNKNIQGLNDTLIEEEDRLYDDLQKIVWNLTDEHHNKFGRPVETEVNITTLPSDARTCQRTYTDDLMKKYHLCDELAKCRKYPELCGIKTLNETPATEMPQTLGSLSTTSTPGKNGSHLFRAAGAGRTRGLTIMTDTLRCAEVPTDSFKGMRIYVHGPDEFPAVGEKGFLVGPGQETQIGVTAIDTYSENALKDMLLAHRMCLFADEFLLKYYKEYSRSSCVIQCEHEYIMERCRCVPFYSPAAVDIDNKVCSKEEMVECVKKAMDNVQILKGSATPTKPLEKPKGKKKSSFSFGEHKGDEKNFKTCPEQCMPACNETFYNIVVSAAQFPNQKEPNKTRLLKEAINEGYEFLTNIDYVSGSISLLRVFFRESTIMQYKRDKLFTWEDFVSNLGGVMSLCLGFSLLSLIEVIYFFTMRAMNDMKRYSREQKPVFNY